MAKRWIKSTNYQKTLYVLCYAPPMQERVMIYCRRIQRAIDYIEDNLGDELSLQEVARQACCSLFHFHRIFQAVVGSSVGEYIRCRRLTRAAYRLVYSRRPIIEIALSHGYESQESFTRAFKRLYGKTPGRYRLRGRYEMRSEKIDICKTIKEIAMTMKSQKPRIVQGEEIRLIGVELRTRTEGGENFRKIPQFWQQFMREGTEKRIPHKVKPGVMYGVCADFSENDSTMSYIIAQEVEPGVQAPPGMVLRVIPPAKYAVFTARGRLPQSVQDTTKYIYSSGLGEWGYERAPGDEFEYYDERCTEDDSCEVDIYIPVK